MIGKRLRYWLAAGALSAVLALGGCGGNTDEITTTAPETDATTTEAPTTQSATTAEATTAAPAANGLTAQSLDTMEPPEHDYSRANKLPLTGYLEKSFEGGRTAKVYLSSEAPIRTYFTVITVPDGIATEEFLEKSGWKEIADEREEGLFLLEPGSSGWGSAEEEASYIEEAMTFYAGNDYFSIFGENYLVGYGNGAAALEHWAAANPLRVISQVYVDSQGLDSSYLNTLADQEFGGTNGKYNEIQFPEGFEKITYDEVVLPTWYIQADPAKIAESLDYWLEANDCVETPADDAALGSVYAQKEDSDRWMTDYWGPISKVAVKEESVDPLSPSTSKEILNFLTTYTRYENIVAYGNTLGLRADYKELGIEVKTMEVNGELREYMVYVPENSSEKFPDGAPVVFVFPGDSQTDKVFLDAAGWWKVAKEEGFVMVTICEQYNKKAIAVSHKDTDLFYEQLKEEILGNSAYHVDPSRVYATGQSAGSMNSQSFAITHPEYFAAVASTSGVVSADDAVTKVTGENGTVSNQSIPVYQIYGTGDLEMLKGNLWDDISNNLDAWAEYHMKVNDVALMDQGDSKVSGKHDRYSTWTWEKDFDGTSVPVMKLTENHYRSHNCIAEEMPMLWNYLKHFRYELADDGTVSARYYSPSGFEKDDEVKIM